VEKTKREWIYSNLMPFLGLVFVLTISFGCAQLLQALVVENFRAFKLSEIIFWAYPLTHLLSVGSLLLLFGLVMMRASRSKWIGVIFLIVGSGVVALPVLDMNFGYIINDSPISDLLNHQFAPPFFYFMGGGIGITGLFSLILPKNDNKLPGS